MDAITNVNIEKWRKELKIKRLYLESSRGSDGHSCLFCDKFYFDYSGLYKHLNKFHSEKSDYIYG